MSDKIVPSGSQAIPVEVAAQLPNSFLPDANWADAFEIETRREFKDMRSLAEQTIGTMPRWARALLMVRNALVVPLKLKSGSLNDEQDAANYVAFFPILEETKDQIVLGLDDRHLDFRIIVDRRKTAEAFRLRATTLVNRHNTFGRIYITLVTPIHRLIVRSVLKNAL